MRIVGPPLDISAKLCGKHRSKGNGSGYSLFGPGDVARTLSAPYHKNGSEILIDREGRSPGLRLSGPAPMHIPVSDTQAYRQFGNSVVVPVVMAVG